MRAILATSFVTAKGQILVSKAIISVNSGRLKGKRHGGRWRRGAKKAVEAGESASIMRFSRERLCGEVFRVVFFGSMRSAIF